jgi:rare lipoprotein A
MFGNGWKSSGVALAMAVLLSACASTEGPTTAGEPAAPASIARTAPSAAPAPAAKPAFQETGLASWYGRPYHGRQTASGEIYNMNQLTAAHRTLPFGTRVTVTNLENGKSVDLTINDRGPFIKGRVIDVSRQGARILGFERRGIVRVRVTSAAAHAG